MYPLLGRPHDSLVQNEGGDEGEGEGDIEYVGAAFSQMNHAFD